MKKFILALAISSMFVMPVYGQAENIDMNENDKELLNRFESALLSVTDTYTKYTTRPVNIRAYPSLDAPILDTSMVNSEFEIALEIEGWAMITTCDGFAFMKMDWFSDTPVEVTQSYSQEDLEILAHVLAGEGQGYPDEEQRLIGSVVLNRIKSHKFPNIIKKVVFQPGQYSCIPDGNYYRTPTERNWANAKWLLENGSVLPEYVVYQSGEPLGKIYLKTKWHYYCY